MHHRLFSLRLAPVRYHLNNIVGILATRLKQVTRHTQAILLKLAIPPCTPAILLPQGNIREATHKLISPSYHPRKDKNDPARYATRQNPDRNQIWSAPGRDSDLAITLTRANHTTPTKSINRHGTTNKPAQATRPDPSETGAA